MVQIIENIPKQSSSFNNGMIIVHTREKFKRLYRKMFIPFVKNHSIYEHDQHLEHMETWSSFYISHQDIDVVLEQH